MADDDGAVRQAGHLTPEGGAPGDVGRVLLVGHEWVADLVPVPEFALQVVDQPGVPLVMGADAGSLDEQDLPNNCHNDPFPASGDTGVDTRRRPVPRPGPRFT